MICTTNNVYCYTLYHPEAIIGKEAAESICSPTTQTSISIAGVKINAAAVLFVIGTVLLYDLLSS